MRAVDTNMKTRETLRRGRLQSGIRSGCDTASPLERTGSDLYLSTAAAYKSGCATICCMRARAARNDSTELTELKRSLGCGCANDRRIGRQYGTRKPRLRDSPAGNHRRLDGIDGARHRHG